MIYMFIVNHVNLVKTLSCTCGTSPCLKVATIAGGVRTSTLSLRE